MATNKPTLTMDAIQRYYLDSGFIIVLATIAWITLSVLKKELIGTKASPAIKHHSGAAPSLARPAMDATTHLKALQVMMGGLA